jgi:hypothetical protein
MIFENERVREMDLINSDPIEEVITVTFEGFGESDCE